MAVLQEQMSKSNNPFLEQVKDDVSPAGTWVATIIDIRDQFGIVRPSFDDPHVTETVDLTTFLFGFRDQAGQPHRIASKTMRISGNEKSTLFGFLKAALGGAPKYGWDYCEMKGRKCLITVAHEQRRNGQGVYPTIAALCPVPAGMAGGHAAEGGVRREESGFGGATLNAPSFAPQGGGYGGQAGAGGVGAVRGVGAVNSGQSAGSAGSPQAVGNGQAGVVTPHVAPMDPSAGLGTGDEPLPF